MIRLLKNDLLWLFPRGVSSEPLDLASSSLVVGLLDDPVLVTTFPFVHSAGSGVTNHKVSAEKLLIVQVMDREQFLGRDSFLDFAILQNLYDDILLNN